MYLPLKIHYPLNHLIHTLKNPHMLSCRERNHGIGIGFDKYDQVGVHQYSVVIEPG